jgi:hypothetical protein
MRRRILMLIGAALAVAASGCHSCDRVENELRARDREVRELRDQLEGAQALNFALQNEVRVSRGEPLTFDPHAPPPVFTSPIKSLTLGRQTGGYDGDGQPGDEALQVVLEPRDGDNQAVKVPAFAEVMAAEVLPDGHKRPLSVWQINADQLRRSWRSGLLGSAFYVILPWQTPPSVEKLRVTARLILPDGRSFEADRDVTVKLLPGVKRMAPAPDQGPPVTPPERMQPADPRPPEKMPPEKPPEQKPGPKKDADGPLLPFPRLLDPTGARKKGPGPATVWWVVPPEAKTTTVAHPGAAVSKPTAELLPPQPLPSPDGAPSGAWRPQR